MLTPSVPIAYNEWAFDKLYEEFKKQGLGNHQAHELAIGIVDLLMKQGAKTMQQHLSNALIMKKGMKVLVDELYHEV